MPKKSLVALIPLFDASLPAEDRLFGFLRQHWPELPPPGEVLHREDVIRFVLGEHTVILSLMPVSIPWADLEGPCRAAWYWPGAAAALRGHVAHILVVMKSKALPRTEAALALTRVVAALAGTSAAAGVFWGGNGTVHAPGPFLDTALHGNQRNLPLDLWIAFALVPEPDGTHSLYTSGMEEFGLLEIEIRSSRRDPQYLRDCAYNVAHYLLLKGPIIKPGETVGVSDEERIPVAFGPSMCDERTTVMQLEL